MKPDYAELTKQLEANEYGTHLNHSLATLEAVIGGTELVLANPIDFDWGRS